MRGFYRAGQSMQFDLETMAAPERYELLLGTVVPRPVAIVTSLSREGAVNAAPYSLFNVMSHDPPILAFSVLPHAERRLKDTAANILAARDFTVNLVPEEMAEAMNLTCIDAPPGTDELKLAGLKTAPSVAIAVPRIASSPVAFECRLETTLSFGPDQSIVFGRILQCHVDDGLVLDAARGLVDTPQLRLIGAMHGARWYARLSDRFAMDRPTWAGWMKQGKGP